MKKVLFLLVMAFVFAMNSFADTVAQCQISGAEQGATVTVSIESCDLEGDVVTVGFYNDSNIPATVTAEVSTVGYRSVKVTAYVPARSSTTKDGEWTPGNSADHITINSARCAQ